MPTDPAGFEQSVFLNYPYDEEYRPFLGALSFTILECGLVPRVAADEDDSGVAWVDGAFTRVLWRTRQEAARLPSEILRSC